jgi:hypothetical protein
MAHQWQSYLGVTRLSVARRAGEYWTESRSIVACGGATSSLVRKLSRHDKGSDATIVRSVAVTSPACVTPANGKVLEASTSSDR